MNIYGVRDIILRRQCMKAPCSAGEGTILVEVLLLYLLTCGPSSSPFTFLATLRAQHFTIQI